MKNTSKRPYILFIILPVLLLAFGAFIIIPFATSKESSKNVEVVLTHDLNVLGELSDMVTNSDYIVLGSYTSFDSTWNMASNPHNPMDESNDKYVEGKLFNFKIEEVLKGNIRDEVIKINHRHSEIVDLEITSGDEVISPEGLLIKSPSKITVHKVNNNYPLFIEPEFGGRYIVFLKKDQFDEIYLRPGEPYLIKVNKNDTVALQSKLLSPDLSSFITENRGEKNITIINEFSTTIDDKVSGMDLIQVLEKIKGELE